jgi:hypothetical protein
MKRTFAFLFTALALVCTANAGELSSPIPDKTSSTEAERPNAAGDAPSALQVPGEPDRFDWEWQSEADYGAAGDLLLGSGISYAASRAFAVGGTYAMAVRPKILGRQDIDPAHYTIFMRWRF